MVLFETLGWYSQLMFFLFSHLLQVSRFLKWIKTHFRKEKFRFITIRSDETIHRWYRTKLWTEGALFIRRNFSFHLRTNPSLLLSLNWTILSIISMILHYSFKFNSPKVLGILDQISGKHLFWCKPRCSLDSHLEQIFRKLIICLIFVFSICPSTWSCCPPLRHRRCALQKGLL